MGRNKKVYITSLHLQHGGVEMAITLLANALVKRNYDVEILCLYNLGIPAYEIDSRVQITYLTSVTPNREEFYTAVQKKNIFKIFKEGIKALRVLYLKKHKMKKAIQSIQTGTIISTRNEHSVLLSKYGQKDVRKIAQLHHDHNFEIGLLNDFKKRYLHIDIFVVLTESLKEEIREIMKNNHHTKLVVIPNFLSNVNVNKKGHMCRKKQVIAVGRLHEVKGFLRMLDIWKGVADKRDITLKIVGEGEEKEAIEHRIQELGIQDKVILSGALDHEKVLQEMEQSMVYVMTSWSEAFPFVLIEAMASGLPIVAYDVRVGPRAIIHNGRNGYLIPDGDKNKFVKKLGELLDDEEKNVTMSKESAQLALKFSEENVIVKWLDIL